jgi:hypothetical protein
MPDVRTHAPASLKPRVEVGVRQKKLAKCRGRESNPHAACATQDFKSCASASSATPATGIIARRTNDLTPSSSLPRPSQGPSAGHDAQVKASARCVELPGSVCRLYFRSEDWLA